jgi:polysaccharide biosynthesis protein PslA
MSDQPLPITRLWAPAESSGCAPLRISPHGLALSFGVLDVASILLGGLLPLFFYESLTGDAAPDYARIVVGTAGFHLAVSFLVRAHHPANVLSARQAVWRGAMAVCLTFGILLLIAALAKITSNYSRVWFVGWAASSLMLVTLHRACTIVYLENKLARGSCLARALLVTVGPGNLNPDRLSFYTQNRTRALAHIQLDDITDLNTLPALAVLHQPDALILEVPWAEVPHVADIARRALQDIAVDVSLVPVLDKQHEGFLRMAHLGSHPIFDVSERPLARWWASLKRAEDIVISLVALLVCLPFLALIATAIRLESRGPVIFRQVRVGFNGREIEVWKFRTMYFDQTDPDASCQTSKGDTRVTRVGRILRKFSFDEIPQFFNVLQGTMSVVGPRPHALKTAVASDLLTKVAERYSSRHRVKPGITGWAQVNGCRGEIDSIEKLRVRIDYDLQYIERWSIWLDLKIILLTVLRIYDPKAY